MLLKKHRISQSFFPTLIKKGRKYSSENMFARVMWLEEEHRNDPIRCSFVISSKVSKSAVKRHMLKRLGYKTIQKNLPNLKKGVVVAFFFTQNITKSSKVAIQNEIELLLKQMNVYEV